MMTFAWQFLLFLVFVGISCSPILWEIFKYWRNRDEIVIVELEDWYDSTYGKDWNTG